MAFNLGGAAGGAFAGASAGASLGPWGALGGAVLGGLGGGLFGGGKKQKFINPYQANPFFKQQYGRLEGLMGNYTNATRQGLSRAGGYDQRVSQLLNQLTSFNAESHYDPDAATNEFLSLAPRLQEVARGSVSPSSDEDLKRQQMALIGQQVSDQFQGNAQSGAMAGAMTQAMAPALLQDAAQRRELQASILNNLYGQTYGGLSQGYIQQSQLEQALNQMRMQQMLSAAEGFGGLASGARSDAGLWANLLGQATQQQTALANPMMVTPQPYTDADAINARDWMGLGLGAFGSAMESGAFRAGGPWSFGRGAPIDYNVTPAITDRAQWMTRFSGGGYRAPGAQPAGYFGL